jgi:hypothetical protein
VLAERHKLSGDRYNEANHADAAERGPSFVHAVNQQGDEANAHQANGNESTGSESHPAPIGTPHPLLKAATLKVGERSTETPEAYTLALGGL